MIREDDVRNYFTNSMNSFQNISNHTFSSPKLPQLSSSKLSTLKHLPDYQYSWQPENPRSKQNLV